MNDPFQWMEEATPKFTSWLDERDQRARIALDGVRGADALRARVSALRASAGGGAESVMPAGGRTFFLRRSASAESSLLFVRDASGRERVLVDPNARGTAGTHASISFATPSRDGRFVAYGLALGGSEDATLHILDVEKSRDLSEEIEGARFANPEWRADNRSFAYTRVEVNASAVNADRYKRTRVYVHKVGTASARDIPIFGLGLSPEVEFKESDRPWVYPHPTGPYYFGWIKPGTGSHVSIFVARSDRPTLEWKRIASTDDGVTSFTVIGDEVYVVSDRDAPNGRILKKPVGSPDAPFSVAVAESDAILQSVDATSNALYMFETVNRRGRLRRLARTDTVATEVKVPLDNVGQVVTNALEAHALVRAEGWTQASTWYNLDARGAVSSAGLPGPTISSFPDIIAEELTVRSGDVDVPLTIVRRKDLKLDRRAPTWLVGYGAYGISMQPYFAPAWLAWLERGGIFAIAHIRGGGEFGDAWHTAGMLSKKQNSIDDFLSCARQLDARGYSSPSNIVAYGVSAGGIVAGSAIIQHPELFGAAILESAICNPLRLERTPIGPANVAEFGSSATPEGYRTLLAFDPYMNMVDSAKYPRVLVSVGANDTRVPPWQSAKFAARLEATAGGSAVPLVRVYKDEGHGAGVAASTRAQIVADEYAFSFQATLGSVPAPL